MAPSTDRLQVSVLLLVLALSISPAPAGLQESSSEPPPPGEEEQVHHDERIEISVAKVVEWIRAGTPVSTLIRRVEAARGSFDLTVEDVIRLRKLGAPPQLILLLARAGDASTSPPPAEAAVEPASAMPPPSSDALTVRKVLRLHRKGVPAEEIAGQIDSKGLREPVDLDQALELRSRGLPASVVLAMAGSSAAHVAARTATEAPAASSERIAAPGRKTKPLKMAEIRRMLEEGLDPGEVAASIEERGIQDPPTLDESLALRRSGATDEVLEAINQAAVRREEAASAEPDDAEEEAGSAPATLAVPLPEDDDTLSVYSVPTGAAVYVAPGRTRLEESLQHRYLAGRTPIALSLPPGDYTVTVRKEAGDFEAGLMPAWRTLHDAPGMLSVLDNAELTFDPKACCLPGSMSGTVDVHPVVEDQPRVIVGDEFDGLPPYLFDGETLQIMGVRRSRITHTAKIYHVRKAAGRPRLLVSAFVPAEGDPLTSSTAASPPEAEPFDRLLAAPELAYLGEAPARQALAAALRVEPDHFGSGVAMLRRAGKAILHQQLDQELRLLTLSLDYGGRLRVTDQTLRPTDLFAAAPVAKGKKKKVLPPPPPPPLPELERTVLPGLGLPRLVLDNATKQGLALLFSDGQFCFVPASTSREFTVDPGTYDLKAFAPKQTGPAPEGRVHLSYHARYTMKFR